MEKLLNDYLGIYMTIVTIGGIGFVVWALFMVVVMIRDAIKCRKGKRK